MGDLTLILWAQEFATPALTAFFTAITSLGSLEFYMFAIPVIYWLIDKHFGFRFALFFIFSAYVNSGAKNIFMTERPPREIRLVEQEGYAFPSGHAQGTTAFWGFLAVKLKKPLAWAGAVILVILVSFSRIYLGVHWPIDILGGLAIATVLLAAYASLAQVNLEKISLRSWMLGSAVGASLLYLLHPTGDGPMTVGFLLGASIGYRLELLHVHFTEEATPLQNVIKLLGGLAVLFVLRIALKPLVSWLPDGIDYVVRYALLGLWASLGAPFTFKKLGLYKKTMVTKTA
ncbi:MAG: phosphatase PAP2 family protein [Limnochordia bacterium]|nr:phosphatase PAP2 family protein [Limnochordia bacterium]